MIVLISLLVAVTVIALLIGKLIVFVANSDYKEECGNCLDYDRDLGCCRQDGVDRPESCAGCDLFRHYKND